MIERDRPERRPYLAPLAWWGIAIGLIGVIAVAFAIAWLGVTAAVEVPDLVGLEEGVAEARLRQTDLIIEVAERPFDPSPEGTVLSQDPAPGTSVSPQTSVVLVVSAGTEEFTLPDVLGRSIAVARAQLEARGLVVRIDTVISDMPIDTVVSSNPGPGATVRTSDIVRLTVSAEGGAIDAMLPYGLSGSSFVIDPSPVPDDEVDITAQIARRLQSLLEASGAAAQATRSTVATDTNETARQAVVLAEDPQFVIGLDVLPTGQGGYQIAVPSEELAPATYQSARLLADTIAAQLRADGSEATVSEYDTDPLLGPDGRAAVRITVGSFTDAEDASAFRDPAWADTIARAIYAGIGERLGTR